VTAEQLGFELRAVAHLVRPWGAPIRDLEQHEQIHQHEREQQRPRPAMEHRARDDRTEERDVDDADEADAGEQVQEADECEPERCAEDNAPRGRQFHREREKHGARVRDRALVPG